MLRGQPALAANATSVPSQRARLDLGFGDFEQKLSEKVVLAVKLGLNGSTWTESRRARLSNNITASLKNGIEDALHPLKLSIGKTWVALPEGAQASYVNQLRASFASTMDRAMDTVETHIRTSLHRVVSIPEQSPTRIGFEDDLLSKAEKMMLMGLLDEHCYGDIPKHNDKQVAVKGTVAIQMRVNNVTATKVIVSKGFCIPSAVVSFVKRLDDNAGLVGMTARFEAGAMELVQKH